jgi:two-component system, LytTR family, response regulator
MNAILVDDEPDGIRVLQKMLERYCPQVQIIATCNSATKALNLLEYQETDIVFLDIRMPGMSGLDLLSQLAVKNFEVIFVTAHSEYMLQALQFSAADYLLKPVVESRLIDAVHRVEKRLRTEKKEARIEALLHNLTQTGHPVDMRLCIPTTKGFIVAELKDIICCEAARSYTTFHLINNNKVTVSKPLIDYCNLLKDIYFLRVHKSYLINLRHVKEYQRGEGGLVILSNGLEIEISRRKKEEFMLKIKEVFMS